MYAPFFGLAQEPFSIAPDPRFLFMSERHREALAHLIYGLNGGGGFVLLSGEIGAGKTTVVRCFLEQIPPNCNVAYIFNPKLSAIELVQSVCDEFGVVAPHPRAEASTVKDFVDALNRYLLRTHAAGQNNVLVIDEAQMLSADVLEQLRLLTNLETNERKLLQIVLVGQPELRTMLARPELEQLAQRVIARFHLGALSEPETAQYVAHRMAVAGLGRASPFDRRALRRIHRISRGVPRRINLLCDRALLGAYAGASPRVTSKIVAQATREVFDPDFAGAGARVSAPRLAAWGAVALAGVAVAVALRVDPRGDASPAAAESAASGVAAASAVVATAVAATAQASAAASAPALPDLAAALTASIADESTAWRELAKAWRIELPDGDACTVAAPQQVQCFRSGGGLGVIRQLDRPAILTLHDGRDPPAYAVLTGLNDQAATLRAGSRSQTVSLATLARQWRGEFATFWRAPPGYSGRVIDARSHASADWLAQRLASLQGAGAPEGEAGSDAGLRAQVQAFQIAQGLKPDGLAGPTTLMQINRATGIDEPRLEGALRVH